MNSACDDLTLWCVRTALDLHTDCWICNHLPHGHLSPRAMQYSRRQKRMYDMRSTTSRNGNSRSSVAGEATREITASPGLIQARLCLESYQRQWRLDKAQRDIKYIIQKKCCKDFIHLCQALYLVYTYKGPYLQNPGAKAKAAHYLRRQRLGEMFVNIFEHDVKWKWLDQRVSHSEIMNDSDPFVNILG
ncbi:hypothetical protein DFH28DRAFT_920752 [Melampsora americana]|nr:hypothetical protein DFH28DRAFT_920752 [Melampsora americana]